jgi:predicted ATPase
MQSGMTSGKGYRNMQQTRYRHAIATLRAARAKRNRDAARAALIVARDASALLALGYN